MNKSSVKSFEIQNISQGMLSNEDVSKCTTNISRKGVVRITFERDRMRYSVENIFDQKMIPIKEIIEYKLPPEDVAHLFEYDLLSLQPSDDDFPFVDGYYWKFKVTAEDGTHKIKGYQIPIPDGAALAKDIADLLHYKEDPWLF